MVPTLQGEYDDKIRSGRLWRFDDEGASEFFFG